MGTNFNSNMLIGILLTFAGIASYIGIVINRYKTKGFKGKLPVIIISAIMVIAGIFLFAMGVIYEWPSLVNSTESAFNSIANFWV